MRTLFRFTVWSFSLLAGCVGIGTIGGVILAPILGAGPAYFLTLVVGSIFGYAMVPILLDEVFNG